MNAAIIFIVFQGGTTSAVSSISDKKDKSLTEINGQLCGLRLKLRVVGGNNAAVGDWPWQVGIARATNPNFPFCGGSLINKQWVVTASHCFGRAGSTSVKPSDIVIRLAEHDTSFAEGSRSFSELSLYFSVPSYSFCIHLKCYLEKQHVYISVKRCDAYFIH